MTDRLINLIQTLSPEELEECQLMVSSPFFNKDSYCIEVFNYLIGLHPDFDEINASSEVLIKKFYSSSKNQEKFLSNTKSRLTRLLEDYLVWKEVRDDEMEKSEVLLKVLYDRQLESHFDSVMKSTLKEMDKKGRGQKFYEYKFKLDIREFYRNIRDVDRQKITNVNEIVESLDRSYILAKLYWIAVQKNMELLIQADNDIALPENIYNMIEDRKIMDNLVLKVYLQLIQIFSECTPEAMDGLLSDLDRVKDEIPKNEMTAIYTFCGNICFGEVVNKQLEYQDRIYKIFHDMELKDVLFASKPKPSRIKNMLTNALKLGDFDRADQVYQKYAKHLPEASKDNADKFNRGLIHFYKGDFKEAMDLLMNVANDSFDFFFQIDARLLVLKASYEIEDYNIFLLYHKKTEQYFKDKKKLSRDLAEPYINFTNLINLLFKLKLENVPENKFKSLAAKINKTEKISDYAWISAKMNELEVRIGKRGRSDWKNY